MSRVIQSQRLLTGLLLLLIAAGCLVRLRSYGDLRLSIANNDTQSYITASEVQIPSWEMFTGRRLFTTNLLFAAFKPETGYQILVNGSPATTHRELQPSFTGMALFQNLLSIFCWSGLILILASRLRDGILRLALCVLMITFAFTPQLADWDSVLTSESLTFSLFALQFALWTLLIFRLFSNPRPDRVTIVLTILWLVTVFFWTFLKDAHIYALLVYALSLAGLLLSRSFRQRRSLFFILSCLGILAGIFLLGWLTTRSSTRSTITLINVYRPNILSVPSRLNFMRELGMPDPSSSEFTGWFSENSQWAYVRFLAAHPGYVLTSYLHDGLASFSTALQPYFTSPEAPAREPLATFGSLMHPSSPAPLLLDAVLLIGLWMLVLRLHPPSGLTWAWLATWLYFCAHINLFINVFGDAFALTRHSLMATTMFRLFLWLFIVVLVDLALHSGPGRENSSPGIKSGGL